MSAIGAYVLEQQIEQDLQGQQEEPTLELDFDLPKVQINKTEEIPF